MNNRNFDRSVYKSMSRSIKGYATNLWVSEIMTQLNVYSVSELHQSLRMNTDKNIERTKSEVKSKFWYNKRNQEPVLRAYKIEEMDKCVPRVSRVLSHPLWQLLSSEHQPIPAEQLYLIAINLSQDVEQLLQIKNSLSESLFLYPIFFTRTYCCQKNKISLTNNLDGLALLLLNYQIVFAYQFSRRGLNKRAFNLFVRLFAFEYLDDCAFSIYQHITSHYICPTDTELRPHLKINEKSSSLGKVLENSPTMFGQIDDEELLLNLLDSYRLIAEKAVELQLISEVEKHEFIFFADHGKLIDLVLEMELYEKGIEIPTLTLLSKILSKIKHYQSKYYHSFN
jgi:hypothetical protein